MNKHLIAIAATAIAVTGCAAPQVQAPAPTEDLNVGIAKTCTPSAVDLSASGTASATIAMTNDGWCGLHTKDKTGQPFLLGLVKSNPAHGIILIQKVGGETRIEYTAKGRYVGPDHFTVALRSSVANTPDVTVQIAVTVAMGEGMPPEPAAAAPAPAPARATTRPARPTTH